MPIAHYRHCPGDHEIWLILYLWLEDPNTLMADLMQLSNILSVFQSYLINARNHRDASKQQSCQNLTHLACLASYCHKWKENPIIPDWNEFWNVFIIKCENLFTQEPAGIILSFYNLPEITLGGGPRIVTVSGMRGLIVIVNILIDSSNQKHPKRVQKYSIEQIKSIQS